MKRLGKLFLLSLLLMLGHRSSLAQPGRPDPELVETKTAVPKLDAPVAYEPKDNTLEVELSEYAGYAGLIVANGGLAENPDSIFAKKHGFKVKLILSEAESWSALNSGKMAASATTVDVLAAYGRQFQVTVPGLIGFSRGADGIVVRKEIRKINDLKGKIVVTSQFTEADFFIRYLAQEAGLGIHMLANLSTPTVADRVNLVYARDAFAAGDLFLRDLKEGKNRIAGCVTWAPKTTEVAEASEGAAYVLVTNVNLLIVADILVVNKGFAEKHPEMVKGLVEGLLEGNQMVRSNPEAHLATIAKGLDWTPEDARDELKKVHLANLPENDAFFAGTIDSAGSYGGIFESANYVYGGELIPNPVSPETFLDRRHLDDIAKAGTFKDQKAEITPIRSQAAPVEHDPLLSKNIRFLFEPNSSRLDMENRDNLLGLESIQKLLKVSPGSTILLRGHVDNALVESFRKQGGEAFVRSQALRAIELSKARAEEIARILIDKYKVDPGRLDKIGRGWEEPLGKDSNENRRVEVQWFTLE